MNSENTELNIEVPEQPTPEQLEARIMELEGENLNLRMELENTVAVNERLSAELATAGHRDQAPQAPQPEGVSESTFELDGNVFGFRRRKVQEDGQIITADEVMASEDLQRKLVEMGSGMLKRVG